MNNKEIPQPPDESTSLDLSARHDALAKKIQENPGLKDIKPSEFVGITLTPRYQKLITGLENIHPTFLEENTILKDPPLAIVEHLLRIVIRRLGEVESPSSELLKRGEFRGDIDQIIFEHEQIGRFNELIIGKLLTDWKEKGII